MPDADAEIARFYSAPASKRSMARGLAVFSILLLAWLVFSGLRNWQAREAQGLAPNYAAALMWIAPLMLFGVGLWIGWGHVRLDLGRLTVSHRPLGLPWPSKTRPLADARRLYVGFHLGPYGVHTAHVSMSRRPEAYWYVHLQGDDFLIPLIVQRKRKEEAMAFAEHIGEAADLPVEVTTRDR